MTGLAQSYRSDADADARVAALSAELAEARAQLRQAKQGGANALTGQIAHDFGNLLGVMIANLDLLDEQLDKGSEPSTLVGEALEAALRASDLTRQLLALTRREPLTPIRVDINQMLARLGDTLDAVADLAGVEIHLDLDPSAAHVTADSAELEARLEALLRRALEAMPTGGLLQITTGSRRLGAENTPFAAPLSGDYVVVEIGDTGPALTADEIARALSPTLAAGSPDDATAEFRQVSNFARQSHGYVDIYAQAETGTTVRLYLPRDGEPLAGTEEPTPDNAGTETVLVVDDNADMRRVVVRQLKELGYKVLEAEDGPSALMTLNGETVHLLFTDVVMPGGLSGFDLARLVTSRWPRMKALITSGFPELEPHGQSAPQAKLRRLNKPYRKSDLAKVLREVLDS